MNQIKYLIQISNFFPPLYNYLRLIIYNPGQEMNSNKIVQEVVERLQECFKNLYATIQEFKRDQRRRITAQVQPKAQQSIPRSLPKQYQLQPKFERDKQRISSNNINPQKLYSSSKPIQHKPFSQMSQYQKDQLRTKLLKERPKPPMNAFISYVKAQKDRIKNSSSKNLSIAEITALASEQWKSLTTEQKVPYIREYELNHVDYIHKRDQFIRQNPIIKKFKIRKAPTKPATNQKIKKKSQQDLQQYVKIQNSRSSSSSVSSSSSQSCAEQEEYQEIPQDKIVPRQENQKSYKNVGGQLFKDKINQSKNTKDRIRIVSYEQRKDKHPEHYLNKNQPQKPKQISQILQAKKKQMNYKIPNNQEAKRQQNQEHKSEQHKTSEQIKSQAKSKLLNILYKKNNCNQLNKTIKNENSSENQSASDSL